MSSKRSLSSQKSLKTLHDLESEYKHLMNKLGWLVVSLHDNNLTDANHYIQNLRELYNSIELKSREIEEGDRYRDLKIMQSNIGQLEKASVLLFTPRK